MLKFQELEQDITDKTTALAVKRIELADVAAKAAKEDAAEPN